MNKETKPTLLLVDGNSLAHRCAYAYKELGFYTENSYIYTGMAYGFIKNLMMLNDKFDPDSLIVVWDGGHKYRTDLYPEYKMKRRMKRLAERKDIKRLKDEQKIENIKNPNDKPAKPPHDFRMEIKDTWSVTKHLGVQQYLSTDEEADDLIGTLVKNLQNKYQITISSNDYDFLQLLNDDIILFRSSGKKQEFHTSEIFQKKYNIHPKFYVNVLAIAGDASDEYPGVSGISEESAFEIVKTYGPKLEMIITKAQAGELSNRWNNAISSQVEMLRLCKKLAKIKTDAPLMQKSSEFNPQLLKEDFEKLKFHSLIYEKDFKKVESVYKPHINVERN